MKNKSIRMVVAIGLAMTAFLIALAFGFLGFALAGAGHGSGIFGYLFFSPVVGGHGSYVLIGLIIWPLVGFLLPWARSLWVSAIILILLGIAYLGIAQDMINEINNVGTTSYAEKVMKTMPDVGFLIVFMFTLMQLIIFGTLIYFRWKNRQTAGKFAEV